MLGIVLAASVSLSLSEPEECQPKTGIHRHQPQFHVIAPMQAVGKDGTKWAGGVNDANAVFEFKGLFHIMHQCDGGPPGQPCGGGHEGPIPSPVPGEQTYWHSWGHVISTDLVHWRRVKDALTPGAINYEHGADCDGTVSFTQGPVMLFGPACGYHPKDSEPSGVGLGDAAVIGVARAENASDPQLLDWVKDSLNPVAFTDGSPPCSFAGRVWQEDGHWNLICSTGGKWARYTSTNDTLHGPWSLADSAFADGKGGASGPAFFPLREPAPGQPTHIISDGSGRNYSVGYYNRSTEHMRVVESFRTDLGSLHWTAAGLAGDGRVLQVGWVSAGHDPTPDPRCPVVGGIAICAVQAISAVRVLSYEAESRMLVSNLPAEFDALHNATLLVRNRTSLAAHATQTLPLPAGTGAAIDLLFAISLPPSQPGPVALRVGIFVNASTSSSSSAETIETSGSGSGSADSEPAPVQLLLNVSAQHADGTRTAQVQGAGAAAGESPAFPILPGETSLSVRAVVDRSIVEFFIGGGRAVKTFRAYPAAGQEGVQLSALEAGVEIVDLEVHEMGCGWEGP